MELVFGGLLTLWDHPGVIALALFACVFVVIYVWIANADLNSLSKICKALFAWNRPSGEIQLKQDTKALYEILQKGSQPTLKARD